MRNRICLSSLANDNNVPKVLGTNQDYLERDCRHPGRHFPVLSRGDAAFETTDDAVNLEGRKTLGTAQDCPHMDDEALFVRHFRFTAESHGLIRHFGSQSTGGGQGTLI